MTTQLNGRAVAEKIRDETRKKLNRLKERGAAPTLAIVRAGEDPSSVSYEKAARSSMEKMGISVETHHYPETIEESDFLQSFKEINNNPQVHGIIVMQPLPESISREKVAAHICPEKDIDGLSPLNLGGLVQDMTTSLAPSTPLAVMELLAHYEIEVKGKDVCIVGGSSVVGKPLALMLLNKGATVSVCHIYTKEVKQYSRQADILVSATGALGLITADHVKEGAVVIDVGFGYDEDGAARGDVRFEEVIEKAAAVTPVPGGVGSITTAVLAKQLVKSAEMILERGK